MVESGYLTTYEAALALVATAMKKSRLRIDALIINAFMGGMLFTTGGMFHIMLQALLRQTFMLNPGIIHLLTGISYSLGLLFVIVMGTELFNSNVLFFTVGLVRGGVSIFDVLISWIISWGFNLVANIFVCYIICYYSGIFASPAYARASREVVMDKLSYSFVQTLIKGMAGNFFVALATYLQIMARPLHVKFFLICFPVVTFVSLGFTHAVADMFLLIMGLINNAPTKVGTIIWKVLIPATLGNIIGGAFFGVVIPWYSHILMVEYDQQLLQLPQYDLRDEQPEINMDSRVVRQRDKDSSDDESSFSIDEPGVKERERLKKNQKEKHNKVKEAEIEEKNSNSADRRSTASSGSNSLDQVSAALPQTIYSSFNHSVDNATTSGLSRLNTGGTAMSSRSRSKSIRSPKNVFPVYGMGAPLEREQSIASGVPYDLDVRNSIAASENSNSNNYNDNDIGIYDGTDDKHTSAEFLGSRIRKVFSRLQRSTNSDLERDPSSERPIPQRAGSGGSLVIVPRLLRRQSSMSNKSKDTHRSNR